MCKLKSCSIFLIILSIFLSGLASAEDVRIALRANKGTQKALAKWQATANYLTKEISGYRFILVPFEIIVHLIRLYHSEIFNFVLLILLQELSIKFVMVHNH